MGTQRCGDKSCFDVGCDDAGCDDAGYAQGYVSHVTSIFLHS